MTSSQQQFEFLHSGSLNKFNLKTIFNILLNSIIATIFFIGIVELAFSINRFWSYDAVWITDIIWAPSATTIDALLFRILFVPKRQAVSFELTRAIARSALILKIPVDARMFILFWTPVATSINTFVLVIGFTLMSL